MGIFFSSYVPAVRTGQQIVRQIISTSSTANAAISFINPEVTPILAQVNYDVVNAGTGTIDIGISDDGTGSNDNIINGGTLTLGVHTANTAGGTKGNISWFRLETSGTTGDSIVGKHSDIPVSTMVGTFVVRYYPAL